MNTEDYNKLIQSLRDLYKEGKFTELKSKYLMSAWMINKSDRDKIESVIGIYYDNKKGEQTLIDEAIKMGCKMVE